ncbi:hypothetical protein XELAEV_18000619mg [Xenopus laevis]|nr:hypothetical protein XELAEV_18000619mg [Xenopus laevis]
MGVDHSFSFLKPIKRCTFILYHFIFFLTECIEQIIMLSIWSCSCSFISRIHETT